MIKCSAIKTVDGQIFIGKRHHHCFAELNKAGASRIGAIQGFLTDDDKFVDREEAYKIAKENGQYNRTGDCTLHILFSEDLY